MKSFKNVVAISLLAVPLAYSEGVLAFDARERVSQAWQNYIKPAASWTLSSRPVKGVGALISAGAASAAVGAAGAGVSYAATRHGAASQYVGAGVGTFAALWFLNEFGKIFADASYAKMNGEKLSDRYTKELEKIERLWNSTLQYLVYLKAQISKKAANNSSPHVHATGSVTQVTVITTNSQQQENKGLVDTRVTIEKDFLKKLNKVFTDSKKRYDDYKFKSPLPDILAEDLSAVVWVNPYAEIKPWYRIDRFFAGITDYMVEKPSADSCFGDLASKLANACSVISVAAKSDAAHLEEAKDVVHIADQIIVLLEQKLKDLDTQAYKIEKALSVAQKLGL